MNKGKVVEQFHYSHILLLLLVYVKVYFHLPSEQTQEGIVKGHVGDKIPSIPDFSTINRRINRLDVKIEDNSTYYYYEFERRLYHSCYKPHRYPGN